MAVAGPYNIPDVPGVPAINFAPGFELGIELLSSDAPALLGLAGPQIWGIFGAGGSSPITADTVLAFEYKQDWQLADFPIEDGAFVSYNKVQIPYDVRFRFIAGENQARRTGLLASIAAIAGDTNLYTAVSPDATYSNMNVMHYDYRRATQNGNGVIIADVWLMQIRLLGGTPTATPQSANAQPQVNGGTVQPTAPTPTVIGGLNVADVAAAGGIP